MIINFEVNFNTYKEKILDFYGIWDFKCPCCNAYRSFSRHATYSRNICILCNSSTFEIIETKIVILRLMCTSCNSTHAILPADTVPYAIYSFSCTMYVLNCIFAEDKTVLNIVEQLKISYQLIYAFIKRFNQCFAPCINFLRVFIASQLDFNASPKAILTAIHMNFDLINFQYQYLNFAKSVFLMSRSQNISSKRLCVGSYFKPPT